MGSRTNSGPLSYYPGDLQVVNATLVNTDTFGDADGTLDPGGLPAGNAGAPAGHDRIQINSATQIGTAASTRRLSVFGPVFLAGAITFTKAAADVITIDGRTTPHTALDDFRENFSRAAGSAAGAQRAAYFDVRSWDVAGTGRLTVATDSLAAIRAEVSGAAGDLAPGGGAVRPNLVGIHIITPDVAPAGAARRGGILIDASGADGINFSPAIGFFPDNDADIGLALADAIGGNRLRPRSIYAATSVVVGASTTITTNAITIGVGAATGTLETSQTTDANGQALTVRSSAGFAGGAASRNGGALNLTAGAGAGGDAGAASGGAVVISAGAGAAVGATAGGGGEITLTAGAAAAGAGAAVPGSAITITASAGISGAGGGAGVGGSVELTAGAGAANGASSGGNINLNSGNGGGTGIGGDIIVTTGAGAGGSRRGVVRSSVDNQDDLGVNEAGGFRWRDLIVSRSVRVFAGLNDANPTTRLETQQLLFGDAVTVDVRIGRNAAAGAIIIDANADGATTVQIGTATAAASAGVIESVNNTMTLRSRRVAAGGGGDISVLGAAAVAPGTGGIVFLTGGNGAANGTGIFSGGAVILRAGNPASVAPDGGVQGTQIQIFSSAAAAGSGVGAASGGDIVIVPGLGANAGRTGVFRASTDNLIDLGGNNNAVGQEVVGHRFRTCNLGTSLDVTAARGDANPRSRVGVGDATGGEVLLGRGGGTAVDIRIKGNGAAGALLIDANGAGAATIQLGATASAGTIESISGTGAGGLTIQTRVTAGAGINLVLTAATAVAGAGGAVDINAGAGVVGAGGAITLDAGAGNGAFAGGAVAITTGGGGVGAGGNGGNVTIITGAAGAASAGRGGDVTIALGAGDGAGRSGQVSFTRNVAGVAADLPVLQLIQDNAAGLTSCLLLRQDDTDVASFRIRNGADGADLLTHIEADPQGHVLRFTTLAPIIEAVGVAMSLRSRVTAGAGVNLNLSAGPAIAGAGGVVAITSGAGVAGVGGNITIITGAGAGAGNNGGDVVFTLGASGGGAGRQGAILPAGDNDGSSIGLAATRWTLVRAVTVTSGAYKEEEVFKEESFEPEELLQALAKELDERDDEGLRNMAKVAMFTGQLVRKKMSDFEQRIQALERRLN